MASEPRVLRILERLARQPAVPLREHAVAAEARAIARGAGASVRTDAFGNLFASPPGRRRGPPVWLVAHMDHPGVEVTDPAEATLRGGLGAQYLRKGLRFRFFHDGGEIAATAASAWRRAGVWRFRLAGPDVRRLRRRDFGVFELADFRRTGGRIHARQLDDLAGCAVSLASLERACRDPSSNLRVLLTRAEELGFVGTLGAAASRSLPRNAWVVSVEASRAIPGGAIGGGPVIRVGDRTRTFDVAAENLLVAARARLPKTRPVQRALMSGGTCEATPWALFGYRTTGVAIPLGNYHNQGPRNRLAAEVVAVRDLATAVDLIEAAAKGARVRRDRDAVLRERLLRTLRRYGGRLRASP